MDRNRKQNKGHPTQNEGHRTKDREHKIKDSENGIKNKGRFAKTDLVAQINKD